MARAVILEPGRTFQEFSLLPGLTSKGCDIPGVSLETKLDTLTLRLPLLSAAMQSVTGTQMMLALGHEGGIGAYPAKWPLEKLEAAILEAKSYNPGFVDDPVTIRETAKVYDALEDISRHGHTKIPVTDRNNHFIGMFTQEHYWRAGVSSTAPITECMLPPEQLLVVREPNISMECAISHMRQKDRPYLVVLDDQGRLEKLALRKDSERIPVGFAIDTHDGWQERVQTGVRAGADLVSIDTSDAFNEYAFDVVEQYLGMNTGVPLVVGNIVTYEATKEFIERGARILKTGMSSGSICTTSRERAAGRAPMTALLEVDRARREHKGPYVSIIADGGIPDAASMNIALTVADAVMAGSYFNRFYEAAGEKFDAQHNPVTEESRIAYVETFGEGSAVAQNLGRYGHRGRTTFFEEGVRGHVDYAGRLKPNLKRDELKIRSALVTAGAMNLEEYRERAVIELVSPAAFGIVKQTHNLAGSR